MDLVPDSALQHGLSNEPFTTLTSRSILLGDLQMLLAGSSPDVSRAEYELLVVSENILQRRSMATRQKTFRYLAELYGLDPAISLFRAMRSLWDADHEARPLLAMMVACARQGLLRSTADYVVNSMPGENLTSHELAFAVENQYPGRWSDGVLARTGRNLASSWQQSGHLTSDSPKKRQRVTARPVSVAFAITLGWWCELRGAALLDSTWMRILDLEPSAADPLLTAASRQGLVEYRKIGDVIDLRPAPQLAGYVR